MPDSIVPVVLALFVSAAVAGSMIVLSRFLGRPRKSKVDHEPYECGIKPFDAVERHRFSVKFYLVAMLFVIFDLEAVFFLPWGALFKELGWFGLGAMTVFTVPLVVGLLYEWRKGALEW